MAKTMSLSISMVLNIPEGCPKPKLEPSSIAQWEAFLFGYRLHVSSDAQRLGLEELDFLLKCVSFANGKLTDILNVGGDQTLVTARFESLDDIERFAKAFKAQYAL